jgi:hypothetical protein
MLVGGYRGNFGNKPKTGAPTPFNPEEERRRMRLPKEGEAEVGAELFGGKVILRYEAAEAFLISDMVEKKTIDAAERLLKASAESIVESSVYAAGVKAITG